MTAPLITKVKHYLGNALGCAIYSKPSCYWSGMRHYCTRGNRHDLFKVHPPGIRFPIYLRRGTSDINNYEQIFVNKEYSFLDIEPQEIMDLGGYIGLASVWLANRYPNAKLLLIEPDPDNYALALLNCRGYANIKCMNFGVWSESCKIELIGQVGGDWGNMFQKVSSDLHDDLHVIEAKSIKDLMTLGGFRKIDFLKIDIEGSEKILFDSPDSLDWIRRCQIISCELHDRMVSGCTESVRGALSLAGFESHKYGEFDYFIRNSPTNPPA